MPTLSLQINPAVPTLGLLPGQQLCYLLLTVTAQATGTGRAVNWALVADASRSMRIPIVDEAQFRALLRNGTAQEMLVDGVPVWQLSGPVPPDIRAAAVSALDFVSRALHSVVERLDAQDRFALIACAEEAVLLNRSTSGAERVDLVRGIARLKSLHVGEQTDLFQGIDLALHELRRGRNTQTSLDRTERLLLLTDGFTQRAEECLQLADAAAAEGISISTIGLGGEFQEDVLTGLADRSAGRAVFLRDATDIPRAIAAELGMARAVAAQAVTLQLELTAGVCLRRATQIRPVLVPRESNTGRTDHIIMLGDIAAQAPVVVLLELLVPTHTAGDVVLGQLQLVSDGAVVADQTLMATYQAQVAPIPPNVLDAAARANAAYLQLRALATAARGANTEAARLLHAAATRLDALGERELAGIARGQANALAQGRPTNPLATKELAYATRRLGGE